MSEREPESGDEERPERDPVNHHPPEEWRPGDMGDPIEEGPPPPGEPPHEPPPHRPPRHRDSPDAPQDGPGELSEGPNGPGAAGPEHAGYAPGYGEYPSAPVDYGNAGGYVPGMGPPPVKPTPWGRILGIGCGVVLLLLLLLGGCAAVLLFMAGTNSPSMPAAPEPGQEAPEPQEEQPSEATLIATTTEFQPSSLYIEGEFTSVRVEVTNVGDQDLDVNPLYFTVLDGDGDEHNPEDAIAMDDEEIDVQTLDPGQTATGTITVEGDIEPERVVFEPYFTGPVEVPVE
ncbi:DUF4352 domain-containing protein [Nocardiopsis sp. MG754419]|uniref:DUF4352 domain-containing protein n=1 Tax=Nocardiopsis sp. MG754419 TaxID=2259865 RepID=UPI0027DAC2DA|nr:DUF4352 domain-containing protein [Nocardiopsis sp. MG754419]